MVDSDLVPKIVRGMLLIGSILLFGSFVAQVMLTPTITVTEVEYEGQSVSQMDSSVYMESLFEVEQEAVRDERVVSSLDSYMAVSVIDVVYASGQVVGDKGIYSLSGTVDYGVYHTGIVFANRFGMALILGGFVLVLTGMSGSRSSSPTSKADGG